jgi:hypothetical protein
MNHFKITINLISLFLPLGLLTGCNSNVVHHYVEPFFEDIYVRPNYDDITIRPHGADVLGEEFEPISYSDYDSKMIQITDGKIKGLQSGVTNVKATSASYSKTLKVYVEDFFSFEDDNWSYRQESYATLGSPKNYTCFLGDSFFDERGYYRNFYTDYAGKEAYCGGLGAATTHDMRKLFSKWVKGCSPLNIVLNISCNNIDNVGEDGPTSFYNLRSLLLDIHESMNNVHVYAMSVTPSKTYASNWIEAQKNNALLKQYASLHSDYLTYLPLGEKFASNEDLYLGDDGMHPSLDGYQAIEEMLASVLTIKERS